jgi:uncharacterized protein
MNTKNFLFFFVHPAKFHQCRKTINTLKEQGHKVDIIITGRDILEELIVNEGWEYKKIFPNGRKLKNVHIWISAGIYLMLTLWKLFWLTVGKRYHFFITDDCLTFISRIKRGKSIFLTDDDLSAVPESSILMISANYILAPDICNLGRFNKKKLGYWGYKSIFHLHPNQFTPDINKIDESLSNQKYFFIRTVSATSTHDVGKRGIGDDLLREIIQFLEPYGRIVLNSERELPDDLKKYVLDFRKNDVSHFVAFSSIFISDSTTMCVESTLLGVPAIEIDDWFGDFKQYYELNEKFQLLFGFSPDDKKGIYNKLDEILSMQDSKEEFMERRNKLFDEKIDASQFLIWLLTESPNSINEYFKNNQSQAKFIVKTHVEINH